MKKLISILACLFAVTTAVDARKLSDADLKHIHIDPIIKDQAAGKSLPIQAMLNWWNKQLQLNEKFDDEDFIEFLVQLRKKFDIFSEVDGPDNYTFIDHVFSSTNNAALFYPTVVAINESGDFKKFDQKLYTANPLDNLFLRLEELGSRSNLLQFALPGMTTPFYLAAEEKYKELENWLVANKSFSITKDRAGELLLPEYALNFAGTSHDQELEDFLIYCFQQGYDPLSPVKSILLKTGGGKSFIDYAASKFFLSPRLLKAAVKKDPAVLTSTFGGMDLLKAIVTKYDYISHRPTKEKKELDAIEIIEFLADHKDVIDFKKDSGDILLLSPTKKIFAALNQTGEFVDIINSNPEKFRKKIEELKVTGTIDQNSQINNLKHILATSTMATPFDLAAQGRYKELEKWLIANKSFLITEKRAAGELLLPEYALYTATFDDTALENFLIFCFQQGYDPLTPVESIVLNTGSVKSFIDYVAEKRHLSPSLLKAAVQKNKDVLTRRFDGMDLLQAIIMFTEYAYISGKQTKETKEPDAIKFIEFLADHKDVIDFKKTYTDPTKNYKDETVLFLSPTQKLFEALYQTGEFVDIVNNNSEKFRKKAMELGIDHISSSPRWEGYLKNLLSSKADTDHLATLWQQLEILKIVAS